MESRLCNRQTDVKTPEEDWILVQPWPLIVSSLVHPAQICFGTLAPDVQLTKEPSTEDVPSHGMRRPARPTGNILSHCICGRACRQSADVHVRHPDDEDGKAWQEEQQRSHASRADWIPEPEK